MEKTLSLEGGPWEVIFDRYKLHNHNFDESPFFITAEEIKEATKNFSRTSEREVRILCKQDSREERPRIFIERNLFLLPVSNGRYAILKGEGYVDIPPISTECQEYSSSLDFNLDTSRVGDSEMQHVDYAYATSLIRNFLEDNSLVLTIRGRKYTPEFEFYAGQPKHKLRVKGVQTEVDAGYEGKDQVVLIEAKNTQRSNIIIRQLFYPFRQWKAYTKKNIVTIFFEHKDGIYRLWHFEFKDEMDYNSIVLVKSGSYKIR